VKTGIQTLFLSIENPGFLPEFIPVKTGAGMTGCRTFCEFIKYLPDFRRQISDLDF
jgi:hypothetical protein